MSDLGEAATETKPTADQRGSWLIHDTSLVLHWPEGEVAPGQTARSSRLRFDRILKILSGLGFKVTADPEVKKRYLPISPNYRLGRRGDLQFAAQIYPVGAKFHFYQDVVRTHKLTGRYEFDQRQRMPYLIGKMYDYVIRAIEAYLSSEGFEKTVRVQSANPAPLAYFNDHWDSSYERARGVHRFRRGADGWPDDSEINCWDRRDADGAILSHGVVRHFRCPKGYLRRGVAYGGINGRWLVVYGPGSLDFTHVSAWEVFTAPVGAPRRDVGKKRRDECLQKALKSAIETHNVQRATAILTTIKRLKEREELPLAA